jgi:hypothetical protein
LSTEFEGRGRAIWTLGYVSERLESLANLRGGWKVAKISRAVRDRVEEAWHRDHRGVLRGLDPSEWIATIELVRYSTARSPGLDDDNLRSAFKPARDEIARQLGLTSDKQTPSLTWLYSEVRGREWGWGWKVKIVACVELTEKPIEPRATKRKRGLAVLATPNTHPPINWSNPWMK